MLFKSCCRLFILISAFGSTLHVLVAGGYPGVVDDEIWHHVLKVLSKEHGGSKILLGHPEPAHLVDAYTKIEYHEPYHHYGHGHHYGGHYGAHHEHHAHGYGYGHHHHHHHAPVYKYKAPVVSSYGPPHHHHHHDHGHHHLGHYKK